MRVLVSPLLLVTTFLAAAGSAPSWAGGGPIFSNGFEPICGTWFEDADGDGWGKTGTESQQCGPLPGFAQVGADCDDTDALVHPEAYEFFDDGQDNNCDTQTDVAVACDQLLELDSTLASDAARALEVCTDAATQGYGLVSAQWMKPDGTAPPAMNFDIGHGIEDGFGPNVDPQAGAKLLLLSSGAARQNGSAGYNNDLNKGYNSGPPPGYPAEYVTCPGSIAGGVVNDGIALEVTVRAPPGAVGLSFAFRNYNRDWPDFVCSTFADRLVAQATPAPPGSSFSGMVAYDNSSDPVWEGSVEACSCLSPPCNHGGYLFSCPLGTADLQGTGFESNGATGWLRSQVIPATGGQDITLRISIYDNGDSTLDSTAVLDALLWHRLP